MTSPARHRIGGVPVPPYDRTVIATLSPVRRLRQRAVIERLPDLDGVAPFAAAEAFRDLPGLAVLECGGPHAFLALRQQYYPLHVIERLLAVIDDPDALYDPYDELRTLQYWAAVNRCDRRVINRQLRQNHIRTSETEVCA